MRSPRPIPLRVRGRDAAPMTVLLADAEIRSVLVTDTGEPLVPIALEGGTQLLRAGVATRLRIAAGLLPRDRRLVLVEGHRSPLDQQRIWDRYSAEVARAHPAADAEERRRLTSRFVSPLEVAPHVAGAAVDVTLVDRHGGPVDLGTPVDATWEESDGACRFEAPIGPRARAERTALARALHLAGFVNYPTEWWHWSFGDRYWAWTTGARAALYGPIAATQDILELDPVLEVAS